MVFTFDNLSLKYYIVPISNTTKGGIRFLITQNNYGKNWRNCQENGNQKGCLPGQDLKKPPESYGNGK
jgi:hypothetical protein